MKIILVIIFSLFATVLRAEVYYCSESYSKGLDNNREERNFVKERYTVNINWQKETISSEELDLQPYNSNCFSRLLFDDSTFIFCSNEFSTTFTFNKDSKEFTTLSSFLNQDRGYQQTITLGFGTCDRF